MLEKLVFLLALGVASCQVPFNCPSLPPLAQPARNVYELRPQDIKVVMAFGDSVTAGFGLMGRHENPFLDLYEYRGQSWSIGADSNAQTIASFLRFYTPGIIGGSLGDHLGELCYGVLCPPFQYRPSKDVFNAAQSGAMASNLVKHEFTYLIEQLHEHPHVDMKNDWKLLTLFIGGNDLCLGCSGDFPTLTPEDFEKHLREVLEEVRTHIPRVFVNLVLAGNLSEIYNLSLKSQYCIDVHRVLPIECVCAFLPGELGDKLRNELDVLASNYNDRMRKVSADYAQKRYPEFTTVVQPFFSEADADKFDISFLSNLDCFHPSLKTHQSMAKALWNNMITPAAQKRTSFNFNELFLCPTNTTLLYTN